MAKVTLEAPTLADVVAARDRIRAYLPATPLRNYPSLDRLTGAEVWVKHDNLLPTGAFKVRGGVNLISQMDAATRARGVIAASTGNHGQSVAFASQLFGVRATVVAPEGANPVKVEAMRDFGAEVLLQGRDYDEAREHCERLAEQHGYRYIHSGDEPHLIAGVGTHTLEILEERPDIDAVIVPIGGGSGAAGTSIVAKATTAPEWQRAIVAMSGTLIVVAIVAAFYWAQIIFIPVALAIFFTFLLSPLVRTLAETR